MATLIVILVLSYIAPILGLMVGALLEFTMETSDKKAARKMFMTAWKWPIMTIKLVYKVVRYREV